MEDQSCCSNIGEESVAVAGVTGRDKESRLLVYRGWQETVLERVCMAGRNIIAN